jgi:hypothetical protein
MMAEPGQEAVQGTLLQGADGSLYFIANEELEVFRVPEDTIPSEENSQDSGYDLSTYETIRAYKDWTAYRSRVPLNWVMSPTIIPAFVARWTSE